MKEKFFSGEDLTGDIGIDGYCTDQGSDYLVVNGKVHGRAYGFEETAVWNPEIVFCRLLRIIRQHFMLHSRQAIRFMPLPYFMITCTDVL